MTAHQCRYTPLSRWLARAINPAGRVTFALAAALLSGCNTVIDPAPYAPQVTFSTAGASCSTNPSLAFVDNAAAATTLECLSKSYGDQRNALMQQNAGLIDLPLAALGTATVANPIFHGATAATTALGLASAVMLGGKSYLGITARIQVLHNASVALQCGASVAASLNSVDAFIKSLGSDKDIDGTLTKLSDDIVDAPVNGISPTAIADATSASTALNSAKLTLASAPEKLSQWASSLMTAASSKQFSGVEDIAALLQAIKNAGPSQTPPTTPLTQSKSLRAMTTQFSAAASIKLYTDQANYLASQITTAWTLQSCPAV